MRKVEMLCMKFTLISSREIVLEANSELAGGD